MCKKHKGFTLVECVVYMFLSVIIMIMAFKILFSSSNIFMETINKSIYINSINEGFLNMDRLIMDEKVVKISSDEDKIILYIGNEKGIYEIQEISRIDNNLVIKYFDIRDFTNYTTRNTIVYSIDDFKVKGKGRLLYIAIKKGGNVYRKCI